MNNEIGRKLTSLTLMTIMLAGGMVIAAPSMMPAASAANETLFVSAENSMFDNTFSGTNVVEVVVSDPLIASLDDAHGIPDVTVNGNDLVMAQATDGSWYAYIVDQTYAETAMQKVAWDPLLGLNYGPECTVATAAYATSSTGASFGSTQGVFFAGGSSSTSGITAIGSAAFGPAACAFSTTGTGDLGGSLYDLDLDAMNVVRDQKSLNQNAALKGHTGQIGLIETGHWPFIQAYDFNPGGQVVIEYKKAGANEIVTLTFDTTSPTQEIDRTTVPDNADVIMNIGDPSLNIDPTAIDQWVFVSDGTVYYMTISGNTVVPTGDLMFEEGDLKFTLANTSSTTLNTRLNADFASGAMTAGTHIGITESGANTSMFSTNDDNDKSTVFVHADATRGNAGVLDYSGAVSIVMNPSFATLTVDSDAVGDEWNSGEELPVTLVDADYNKKTTADEDFAVSNAGTDLIPTIQIGSPVTIGGTGQTVTSVTFWSGAGGGTAYSNTNAQFDKYGHIARIIAPTELEIVGTSLSLNVNTGMTLADLRALSTTGSSVAGYLNYDIRSLITAFGTTAATAIDFAIGTSDTDGGDVMALTGGLNVSGLGFTPLSDNLRNYADEDGTVIIDFVVTIAAGTKLPAGTYPIAADIFSFGDTTNNAIYRIQVEESGDNTGVFEGSIEYQMANQINFADAQIVTTVNGWLDPISDSVNIIVTGLSTDEDAIRVNYLDLGADGVSTQIADQQDALTHNGVADLDLDTYKIADTVVLTITDMDLNVDTELIDIYQVQSADTDGTASDTTLFSVTFDDNEWADLGSQGLTMVETSASSGIFQGTFQVPEFYTGTTTATGTDIEINYMDHRDAGGNSIEVGDGAGIRANTGSVSLDRTVYPVPWGLASSYTDYTSTGTDKTPASNSVFPVHASGVSGTLDTAAEQINGSSAGDVIIHVRVTDADLDTAATGQDKMETNKSGSSVGPIKITMTRGTSVMTLGYAGGDTVSTTKYIVASTDTAEAARTMGPITEVAGDAGGVFELDFTIKHTDGPESATCPTPDSDTAGVPDGWTGTDAAGSSRSDRFASNPTSGTEFCVLQGDILTVEYTDAHDASGNANTVTDSATFDLRNGVLQADKSVYLIGSDMIVTIIEPDWDLDNDVTESYDIDVVEWDSAAYTTTLSTSGFDPEPGSFRETGDSTGIFQVVIEVPATLNSVNLERGEKIDLEYTDWGPSGASFVGQEDQDVNLTAFTSNFGATVELDQKVYTWTDKVYITIVAPDHNFDSNLIDSIGDTSDDAVKVSTRSYDINKYKLVETGTDTGIFTGEVILTGFSHDADGDGTDTRPGAATSADSTGPTNGKLETASDDGLTVSFEYSEDATVVGSALVRWNIGEVQWLESSYPASGTGVVRIIDPDMNQNPEAVDNFNVPTWSDSDAGGITLTVTETNESTGIFEGTVFFTVSDASSGHRLRVSEGDTVTAEYTDHTLPAPYTNADDLAVAATSLIGTVVPPLERAPAANLRTVDAFGNSLNAVSVDQQVQLTADLANGQDKDQAFAYLVQVQDGNGVTVSLAWITGSLSAGQSFSPALSWIPTESGSYTATAFVWESVDNPTALSPSVSTTVNVN